MFWDITNNVNPTESFYDLTLLTHWFYACSNFHSNPCLALRLTIQGTRYEFVPAATCAAKLFNVIGE
jgi:hypothetical protein